MKMKVRMILDAAPNPYAALFALRLLTSPKRVREEWHGADYRFPWERGRA